ncbi:MAG: peptidase T [Deltaproteobacteria bacterium RBG_13_49_15]|nr:MAG: peptidase T [Deltaproteobacteria bacterium RBG_13_49_15]
MINQIRLKDTFLSLVRISSVSKKEAVFSKDIQRRLEKIGAKVFVDDSSGKTGSDTGNLIARLPGNRDAPPLLLSAHMDTVQPGKGIKPVFKDGVFRSNGKTILGADDKSAIAVILETIQTLHENDTPYGPLELVFTVCEEDALAGARNLDFSLISSKYGYALDATDTEGIVTRAPAADRLMFKVFGKEAHAGAAPEKGINAIQLACRAIASLDLGRIDRETTCNIGVIEGGFATNIIPNLVTVTGEARSHDVEKLKQATETIVHAFEKAVNSYQGPGAGDGLPRLETHVEKSFSKTSIPEDHFIVKLARTAALQLGRTITCKPSGGGSDANIFFEKGIIVGVLGTGMRDMHTVSEWIRLDDMVRTGELLMKIIALHAKE